MDCVTKRVDDVLHVDMRGKCTFSDYTHFKEMVDIVEKFPIKQIDVELAHLEYVDSSGLGMLLMLNEKTGGRAVIRLISPQGQVKKMLDIARLGNVFSIVA
jgi:anti-anti-sigma factor